MIFIVEKVKLMSESIVDEDGSIEGSHTSNNANFKGVFDD